MTGLAISTVFGGFMGKLSAALAWMFKSAARILGVAFAIALAWGWLGWHKADGWHKIANTFEAARNADRAAYVAAQASAKAAQEAADLAISASYSTIAKDSDHEYRQAMGNARSAVDRYAATHRLRPAITYRSTSDPEPTSLPVDPSQPAGDGGDADLVAITRKELDQLSGAAVQNASRGNFLQRLIDEGLAIEAPELPAVAF